LNNQARDRFKEIKTYRVIQERAFDLRKLVQNSEFDHQIRTRSRELLNEMFFEKENKIVTLEFHANARNSGRNTILLCGERLLIIALRLLTNCWLLFCLKNAMFRGGKMKTRIGMMRSGRATSHFVLGRSYMA